MTRSSRLALAMLAACAAAVLATPVAGDFPAEAGPSVSALLGGDIHRALTLAPSYGPSLMVRAPAFALADALGGGQLAVYRAGALVCMLALAALGLALTALRRSGTERGAVLAIAIGTPLLLGALSYGHPEEALGAALCTAGVLMATRGRPGAAGALAGAAFAVKPWGVLAIAPVLVALDGGARPRAIALASAGAAAAALLAPFVLVAGAAAGPASGAARGALAWFRPQQLFWPLGIEQIHVADGIRYVGHRAPGWVAAHSRAAIVALSIPFGLLAWRARRRRAAPAHDAFALLALLLLARCALDPWNITYYALPAVIALLAFELHARPRGVPLLAPAVAAATWISFEGAARAGLSGDARFALYAGWIVPLIVLLGARVAGLRPSAPLRVGGDTVARVGRDAAA